MRPALCGYCKIPSGPFMRIEDERIYGACTHEHLKLLREEKKLKRIAITCDDGLDYAISKTKQTYIDMSKKNKTYVLHEWERKDRKLLFSRVVNEYMTWANHQAQTGRMDKVVRDGSD